MKTYKFNAFITIGGILEEHESYIDCALRETEEEIGIGRDRVSLWGQTSLIQLRDVPPIMPVIGMIHEYNSDLLKINSHEVERVFTVPLSELLGKRKHTQYRMVGQNSLVKSNTDTHSIPLFDVDEARIWGITAIMTHLFLRSFLPSQFYDHKIPHVSKYK